MNFTTSYNSLDRLYEMHLTAIKNIKFTFREIDVIACIMHNRGEKKIAVLLSVSPRTVSAHVYNIMGKLGCSTKDQIIDFIESSDKLNIIKEYYLHLCVKSNFEQKLIKIASGINRSKLKVYYRKNDKLHISDPMYRSLEKHFQLAGIFLYEADNNDSVGFDDKLIVELNKITEEDYYNNFFQILPELIESPAITETIEDFNDSYKLIRNIYEGKTNHLAITNNTKVRLFKKRNFIIALVLILFLVTALIIGNKGFSLEDKVADKAPEIVKALEDFIVTLKKDQFTADNVSAAQAKHNHNIIKKVEKLLEYKNTKEVREYFKRSEMSAGLLTNYLYNLQAIASYYMYNKHDGSKSREILSHAKELAELYVNVRSFNNDFDQLSHAEILTELQIADDLPQIYTRIIYSIGRTYMYEDNIIPSKKYFELAEYLGNKLGLFEGYLSELSGILVIEKELARLNIKDGKINYAKEILKNINISLDKMRNDGASYILNYKPETQEQQTIIPKDQAYNMFECGNKIIGNYYILLSVGNNTEEIQEYIDSINDQLVGNNATKGLFKIAQEVPQKKLADLYNNLGNIIIILRKLKEQDNINLRDIELKTNIAEFLSTDLTEYLELAEILFSTAKDMSRSIDFTKADGYNGLALVNKLKLEHKNDILSEQQKNELREKINTHIQKAKSINDRLNRKNKSI